MQTWPSLQYDQWKDTLDTLHMYMQIVGKVKVELCPFLNQWWETAFYITAIGMTTGRIPYKKEAFSIDFDFIHHKLIIQTSSGKENIILLKSYSVAKFYDVFMKALKKLKISVSIYPVPVEFADPIPFKKDITHSSYDKAYVARWWRILLQTSFVFDLFRRYFRGKSSPIHFFWGSFDLVGTRFSGKKADPPHLKGILGKIMKYSENEENFTFGFWPGDKKFPYPAFYSYIYPAPNGFETINTGPASSYFNKKLSLSILPYENVRKSSNPKKQILQFLETTYKESAQLAKWDIKTLKGSIPT